MDAQSDRRLTRMVIVAEEDESNVQRVELVRREAKPCGTWERSVGCLLVFLLVCCGGLITIWFWANYSSASDQDWLKQKGELTAATMPMVENCTNSTPAQVQAWPPKKKRWCCEHQNRGCPNAVMKIPTFASTSSGCKAKCTVKATSASCNSRMFFAAHFLFAAKDMPCDAAYTWMLSKCPGCSGCQSVSSGCKDVQPTTTSAAVAPAKHACDTLCAGNDGHVSCKQRVMAIANSTFAGDPDACVLAFASVLKSCQVCAACPLANVGCSGVATHSEKVAHQVT